MILSQIENMTQLPEFSMFSVKKLRTQIEKVSKQTNEMFEVF